MANCLTAYFILSVIKIKLITCVKEKIELSMMSLLSDIRLTSAKISGDFSLTTKIKQQ